MGRMRQFVTTVAFGIVASACANTHTIVMPAAPTSTAPMVFEEPQGTVAPDPGKTTVEQVLPDVTVTDIATSREIPVRSIFPASRPVLLWFWAPH